MGYRPLLCAVALASLMVDAPRARGDDTAGASATSSAATTTVGVRAKPGDATAGGNAAIAAHASPATARAKARATSRLQAVAAKVDQAAAKDASKVASRMAQEFATTSEALTDEKNGLAASWGDLMIAHTFEANVASGESAALLLKMHEGGMSWGAVASGLGLDLRSAVNGANAEASVMTGSAKVDGRAALIRRDVAHPVGTDATAGLGAAASHGPLTVGTGGAATVKIGR